MAAQFTKSLAVKWWDGSRLSLRERACFRRANADNAMHVTHYFFAPPQPWCSVVRKEIAMRRPQFSLGTLLWLVAVVAAFCGGLPTTWPTAD
jgi:hypothetical protein